MLKFSEHRDLNEGLFDGFVNFIRKAYNGIVNGFKKAFSALTNVKMGSIKRVKVGSMIKEEEVKQDSKSRLGYYSEYVCGQALAELIESKGLNLPGTQSSKVFAKAKKAFHDNKLKTLTNYKSLASEIERMEDGGKAMAESIFSDMLAETADLKITNFDIQLTGDSLKGESKADIVLSARKKDKGAVVKEIAASLKAYKSSSINLANSTLLSLFASLTKDKNFTSKALEKAQKVIYDTMLKAASKDLGKSKAIALLTNKIRNDKEKKLFKKYKDIGRKASKETQTNTADIIVKEFNAVYRKNKSKINENLLELIGMDGSDDFYASIGEGKKMRVLSSRQSPELQKFLQEVRSKFLTIVMTPKPGKAGRASVTVDLMIGKTMLSSSSITMTDTGIGSGAMTKSTGQIKTNFWFNFNNF
jgi:hypothetical protein